MKIYTIGRDHPGTDSDIVIPANQDTVGRTHLNLSCEDDGRYCVTDRGALNKSFLMQGGVWHQISEAFVQLDTPLMLGSYQTTVENLLAMAKEQEEEKLHESMLPNDPDPDPKQESTVAVENLIHQEKTTPPPTKKGFWGRIFGG